MELATGAMGSLLPKLTELLQEQYNLQAGVRKDVESLSRELKSIQVALTKIAEVPRDQLDTQVKLWADNVRELSYEMEDVVDGFMVRVDGSEPAADMKRSKRFREKIANFFRKGKTRRRIAGKIEEIKVRVKEVADLRDRYKFNDVRANPAAATTIDPRVVALFKDQRELVGIEGPREELIKKMTDGDDGGSNSDSKQQLKVLSIYGLGGLGKTTLAKAVYERLEAKFDRKAFVPVGQNPDVKKVLRDILLELDEASCSNATMLDERQLIGKLRGLLEDKRYLIVIDDVWNQSSWEVIRGALIDSKRGSRIILTTRIFDVAKEADDVYKQRPLSSDSSKKLFDTRLSIGKCENPHDQLVEMSEKILQKCDGVPLAIITIASLLVNKPREDWSEVYHSIGFGNGDNKQVDNTRKILLFSYYDLPFYLKNCLLHLSIYPEDYKIPKDTLIWKWVAEGFVHKEPGMRLFELGERYFNELINRCMVQPLEEPDKGVVYACHVHDLVLDMINSLAKEEKFVILLRSNEQHTSSHNNARRLAIQKRVADEHQDLNLANANMRQVRSFNATECHLGIRPLLSNFQVLRVLSLEGCTLSEDHPSHLEHLGRLLQLRYLLLSGMQITELPEEIGELRFLQTLNLEDTGIRELPRSVGLLRQLKCLRLPHFLRGVLDWIGNLTSLEELSVSVVSPELVKELRKLTELRVFKVPSIVSKATLKDLMVSTGHLQKLQVLGIFYQGGELFEWANCGDYVPSRHLRYLDLINFELPRVPAWVDSSHLPHLFYLRFSVKAVEAQDMEILGKFPELISLTLWTNEYLDVVGGGAFPKLRRFNTTGMLRFLPGAMPRLEFVSYDICPEYKNREHDFAGLGNLPCLQKIRVYMLYDNVEGQAALRHAVKVHPNNPTLEIQRVRSGLTLRYVCLGARAAAAARTRPQANVTQRNMDSNTLTHTQGRFRRRSIQLRGDGLAS